MIDIAKLPGHVVSDLMDAQAEGVRIDLAHDTVSELFDKWLKWNGIIGYTENIISALDGIRKAAALPN